MRRQRHWESSSPGRSRGYGKSAALLLMVALVGSACSGAASDGTGETEQDTTQSPASQTGESQQGEAETVSVGVPLSLSGPVAFAGEKMRSAMELAFDEVNAELDEVQLEPIFADDQSEQTVAIDVTTRLIDREDVAAIVGYTASNICQAALPIAQEKKTPAVNSDCVVPGLTDIGEYIFSAVIPYDQFVRDMIGKLAEDLSLETAGIIYLQENPVFENMQSVMAEAFEQAGVKVTGIEAVPSGDDADFSAQLTELAQGDPDALAVLLLGGQSGPAIDQARQAGMTDTVILGEQNLNSSEVLRTAGDAAVGTYYPTHWTPLADFERNQAYIDAYTERFGEKPDTFATNGYVGVHVLADAIAEVGPPSGYEGTQAYRDAIRDALASLTEIETVFGNGTMQMEDRAVVIDSVLIEVEEGPTPTLYEGDS